MPQIQIVATWIFYAVLTEVCSEVAVALNEPIERISVEMVFRAFYHFSQALLLGQARELVSYLAQHHKLLGLVKAVRKRHLLRDAISEQVWAATSLS